MRARRLLAILVIVGVVVQATGSPGTGDPPPLTLVADMNGVDDLSPGSQADSLLAADGSVFFRGPAGKLWWSDGTDAGTRGVGDVTLGNGSTLHPGAFLGTLGELVLFAGNDGVHGEEIWRTDGTDAGTLMIADTIPGNASFLFQAGGVSLNGVFYFAATDSRGRELWATDGASIWLVADIRPGPGNGLAAVRNGRVNLAVADGRLWFYADDGVNGISLWRTNESTGVPERPVEGSLTRGYSGSEFVTSTLGGPQLAAVGDDLYFLAEHDLVEWTFCGPYSEPFWCTTEFRRGLWRWPRGAALPEFLATVSGGTFPTHLTAADEHLYFSVWPVGSPVQLWVSGGTKESTLPVVDQTGTFLADPPHWAAIGRDLLIPGRDAAHGTELWRIDADAVEGHLLVDLNPGSGDGAHLSASAMLDSSTLLFVGNDGAHGSELWRTDGTPGGTTLVRDIRPGAGGGVLPTTPFSACCGVAYFWADDGVHGTELWKSDGTETGTTLVRDLAHVPGSSAPLPLVAMGESLLFSASDAAGNLGLWRTDGTPGSQVAVGPLGHSVDSADPWIGGGGGGGSSGSDGTGPVRVSHPIGGWVYFAQGARLWRTDGTEGSASLVREIETATGQPAVALSGLQELAGALLFIAENGAGRRTLWVSDGTASGTHPVGSDVAVSGIESVVGGFALFAGSDGEHGLEPWRTDGTPEGTLLVRDVRAGPAGSGCAFLAAGTAAAYFTADDGTHGTELWRTDGTEDGTWMPAEARAGALTSAVQSALAIGGLVLFDPDDGTHGREVWVSDGTAPGTHILADIWPGPTSSEPGSFVVHGGAAWFVATDPVGGRGLWRTDGTPGGTSRVGTVPWGSSSLVSWAAKGVLLFAVNTSDYGDEAWCADESGARLLWDLAPGTASSSPNGFVAAGPRAYFSAVESASGRELWMAGKPLPPEAGLAVSAGWIKDYVVIPKRKTRRSKAQVAGQWTLPGGVPAAVDPAADGLSLRFGAEGATGALVIEPGDAGWSVTGGAEIWRGASDGVSWFVKLKPARGTFQVRTWGLPPVAFQDGDGVPVRISIETGPLRGASEESWTVTAVPSPRLSLFLQR